MPELDNHHFAKKSNRQIFCNIFFVDFTFISLILCNIHLQYRQNVNDSLPKNHVDESRIELCGNLKCIYLTPRGTV